MAWNQTGSLKGPQGDPGTPAPQDAVTSTTVEKIWTGTQAAYDGIATKDPTTLYIITGAA